MKVKDIMTVTVETATPETSLEDIAKKLVECDCGAIPVLKSENSKKPVGIVTARHRLAAPWPGRTLAS